MSQGGGSGGEGTPTGADPDPFDGLVLDEDFVRDAVVREAPAHVRVGPPRSALPPRRNRRTRARAWLSGHRGAVLVVLVVGAVVVAGLAGVGPMAGVLHSKTSSKSASGPAARSTVTSVGGTTSTTDPSIQRRSYQRGQCVTYEQSQSDPATHVVPCSQPHLMEMVGLGHAPEPPSGAADGPTAAEWVAIDQQVCGPLAQQFLGQPLDPNGRFSTGSIKPGPVAWAQGDRDMWCGISAQPANGVPLPDDHLAPFTGEARGASQAYLYDPGICLAATADAAGSSTVACTSPHAEEVTGTATVPSQITSYPTTSDAWQAIVGSACGALAAAYHGGPLPPSLRAGWLQLAQTSWNVGQRVVNCTVSAVDAAGGALSLSGSARAGGVPH